MVKPFRTFTISLGKHQYDMIYNIHRFNDSIQILLLLKVKNYLNPSLTRKRLSTSSGGKGEDHHPGYRAQPQCPAFSLPILMFESFFYMTTLLSGLTGCCVPTRRVRAATLPGEKLSKQPKTANLRKTQICCVPSVFNCLLPVPHPVSTGPYSQ